MVRPSPFAGISQAEWPVVTARLVAGYPVSPARLLASVEAALQNKLSPKMLSAGLSEVEFALDHGMKAKNLPREYKGLERGFPHFLAFSVARAMIKEEPKTWLLEDAGWGVVLRHSADGHYSLKILATGSADALECSTNGPDAILPSGYVLAIHSPAEHPGQFGFY